MANCVNNEPNYSGGGYSTASSGGYSSGTTETAYGVTVDFSGNWGYTENAVSSSPKANKYKTDFIRAGKSLDCDWRMIAALAQTESGMNPAAQNSKSSAGGIFQFIDSTWTSCAPKGMKSITYKHDVSASVSALITMWQTTKKKFASCPTNDRIALMIQGHHDGTGGIHTVKGNKWANYAPKRNNEGVKYLHRVIEFYKQFCK